MTRHRDISRDWPRQRPHPALDRFVVALLIFGYLCVATSWTYVPASPPILLAVWIISAFGFRWLWQQYRERTTPWPQRNQPTVRLPLPVRLMLLLRPPPRRHQQRQQGPADRLDTPRTPPPSRSRPWRTFSIATGTIPIDHRTDQP